LFIEALIVPHDIVVIMIMPYWKFMAPSFIKKWVVNTFIFSFISTFLAVFS